MTITAGKLRALTQPPILIRMDKPVAEASGEGDRTGPVFEAGMVLFAQYIGNGRLELTPLNPTLGWGSHVVMASALNSTASILNGAEVEPLLITATERPPLKVASLP